ncbi:MAG: phage major capsid protein [Pirellulales bacterium]
MKKIQEINARLEAIADELQALSDLSQENDLDDTQVQLVNELDSEFSVLETQRESLQVVQDKLDAARAAKADPKASSIVEPSQIENVIEEEKTMIPAKVKNQRSKHFASSEDAYISGMYLSSLAGDRRAQDFMAAQSGGTDNKGGFSVPDPLSNALINLIEDRGTARQKAQRIVMSSDTWSVPKVTAQATIYYPAEAAAITESDVTFGQVQLSAKKLAALVKMSTEITEDSVLSMLDVVVDSIAYSIALEEDKNLFNGVAGGVNASGIAGDASVDDTNVASVAALALTDLTECASGIGNPVVGAVNEWYMSPVVFHSQVRDLLNAAGGNAVADIENGQRPLLLGYPVNLVSCLPAAPASGELVAAFGDLRIGAYFGDRRALNFKTLNELYMENDQIAVIATERIDIQVSNGEVLSKITIT